MRTARGAPRGGRGETSGLAFEEPEPEVLFVGAVAVAGFEAGFFGEFDGLLVGEGDADPGVVGGGFVDDAVLFDVALDLEFEEGAGAEEAVDFADVGFDDFARGDVLEDDGGEGEVAGGVGEVGVEDGEVGAVVLEGVGVGAVGEEAGGAGDHFAADVDGVDFAEEAGEGAGDAAGAAADFEDAHLLGVLALADVAHVGEDLFGDGAFAGGDELFVGPIVALGVDVVAGVFAGAVVPVAAHFFELLGGGEFRAHASFPWYAGVGGSGKGGAGFGIVEGNPCGRLAQLGEHHVRNVGVVGSNPMPSTNSGSIPFDDLAVRRSVSGGGAMPL